MQVFISHIHVLLNNLLLPRNVVAILVLSFFCTTARGDPLPADFVALQWHGDAQYFFFAKGHPDMPYQSVNRDESLRVEQDGVVIYIDHLPSQRLAENVVPVIQIFDEHMPAISAVFSDSETVSGSVWVAFARLDPGTEKPQIVMTRNQGGGAICCFETTIFSKIASGWERIEAPYQYADLHYRIMDVDGDGYAELVGLDSDYLAAGRRTRPEPIPVLVYALRGPELRDVTDNTAHANGTFMEGE
ncbi:hypothetical protein O9Z70_13305 [Devosia sp. YIM 151766]|uniref:hypothetical protein n=1 Tax=Devosia sp. YIM 151766 TaxID=3017325 RepID=UPI00255CCDD2|nr:hypothetical protein [Devosia sp. YIM 151766]WIY52427.1 hypothetical protein O9Z70_13305 [Devosia sp. YIM 151766]